MLEAMTRNWGAIALRGFIAVLFGVIAIVWPGPTVAVLVILLGAFALVEGVT
ncbi:MAG: HdeD family acid-resistance protein, partial [Chloroflexi bacterium]